MIKRLVRHALSHVYRRQLAFAPCKYVFILGHMRSGSSLLVHILNSHPEITGYGETHLTYHTQQDLDRLACGVFCTLRRLRVTRYVLDKILAEGLLSDEMLRTPGISYIFLLREPIASVKSMMREFPTWFTDDQLPREVLQRKAMEHYETRLRTLEKQASIMTNRHQTIIVTYDELLTRTTEVLSLIQEFLDLDDPLKETYDTTRTTGVFGIGDPGKYIHRGRVVRTIRHPEQPLDLKLMEPLLDLHDSVQRDIRQHCRGLSRAPSRGST